MDERAPDTSVCESGIAIERFKELIVVDEAVIGDDRAKNLTSGTWSFRRRIEELTPAGKDPAATLTEWLRSFRPPTKVNLFDVPGRPLVEAKAICAWLRSTPSNACDFTCQVCTERRLLLENAPFRLMAITNRADLVQLNDDPATAGEARFVYALTNGAGDDPSSPSMEMTAIFEYRQPLRGRTRKQLAEAWHALGRHATFDEAYKAELEALMKTFHEPGAEPERPVGSGIGQIRTNEREFDWQWELREFKVTENGFVIGPTGNTPDASLNGSERLGAFLRENREQILAGKHVLPPNFSGGFAQNLSQWSAPVESDLVRAFSNETCNGCHMNRNIDFNFQISPHKKGIARLAPFLHDPADPTHDDASKRETFMRKQLCSSDAAK